jgi:Tol biopolymer transport system component
MKRTKRYFIKLLLCNLLILLYIGGFCESPYTTNSNLKLIAGDTVRHSTHNFNPVVSSSGDRVYYLSVSIDEWSGMFEDQTGSIYSVNADGSDVTEILDGMYDNLAISLNGNNLAVQHFKGDYLDPDPESLIVVVDVATSNTESLWISPKERLKKIVWNNSSEYLYFLSSDAIRRVSLADSSEELVVTISGIKGFDLFGNDSIHTDTVLWNPEIEPNDQQYILGSNDIFSLDLLILNSQDGTLFALPESLTPYIEKWVGQPYWFPDGSTIVFASGAVGGGTPGCDPTEIWILENLFDQIE